ncbi:O-antigen translocase [Flavobacterium sp. H122]|uniref:O-antigen translocase n=1 Tax=Flavobacterium sp. H122 TaxID=2529860 RepID=UPI0010A9E414|nr:O-antigen translocase [Flavobacterium sp. H122]
MNLLKKIKSSQSFRFTSLNSINVLLRILIGVVSSKFLAFFLGPTGLAIVGSFRNFSSLIESLTTLGFQNGIVKFVVDNKSDKLKLKRLFSTLFFITFIVSLIIGIILFVFSSQISSLVFKGNKSYVILFKIMSFLLPSNVLGIYMLSVINGYGRFKRVIFINMISNIITLLVSIIFIYYYNTMGALLSIIITPLFLFFIVFAFMPERENLNQIFNFNFFDIEIVKNLSHFLLMMVFSGVVGQMIQIFIRNKIIGVSGLDSAGYWEAMNRISVYYMLFINSFLGVYYFPKLIEARDESTTRSVWYDYYKIIVPLFLVGAIIIFIFRGLIIEILFNRDFLMVKKLFLWQLIGDLFKTMSWILGMQLLAKQMTKAFLFFEALSFIILYVASLFFIPMIGIEGAVLSHAVNYFLYWLFLVFYFRKTLGIKSNS